MLSIATDYAADHGSAEPYLRRIAAAGFTHVHWCHEWNTDFLYPDAEIEQIRGWLDAFGLRVLDLHASAGQEKNWCAPHPDVRAAGVELIVNRMRMAAAFASDVIVLHLRSRGDRAEPSYWQDVGQSLSELEPEAARLGVRIAMENGPWRGIARVLGDQAPGFIGLCYDSGHGNLPERDGLTHLESWLERLIAIHLHDNDGRADQHRLPFLGSVDWPRLARAVARSRYDKCVSLEVSMRGSGFEDEDAFLRAALERGAALARMIANEGGGAVATST
ncbi:MAG: sugar phosphate isomerase/epimerase [Kiritimatiellae bacterium]|nr:sugar phosphate isomerase/epimerase [Kiritimatiellia bacterium]